MRHTTTTSRYAMSLLTLALVSGLAVLAVDGRDFAGFYETSNELESGEEVGMTFKVEIVNHSGVDVLGATVQLENPLDPEIPLAAWASVDIAHRQRCALTAEVAVPPREREMWRKGRMPRLTVEYEDTAGVTRRGRVELTSGRVFLEGGQS